MARKQSDFVGLNYQELLIISEELVDSRLWPIFKKVIGLRRDALAGNLLEIYTDKGDQLLNRVQGKAEGLNEIVDFFRSINTYVKQEEARKDEASRSK